MYKNLIKTLGASAAVALITFGATAPATAKVGFGKPGEPVNLVIGYQPYYTESWSGVVLNGKQMWKKHLPKGSTAKFEIGLQGSVIVGKLLGEKNHIGYMGDMPAIVSSMREKQVDLRMISVLGTSKQQCNIFLVPNNAPKFKNGMEAVKWMDGKLVAAPHGACTDRFALLAFEQAGIKPSKYLNQNIENITKNLEAGKIAAAAIWEPTASKIVDAYRKQPGAQDNVNITRIPGPPGSGVAWGPTQISVSDGSDATVLAHELRHTQQPGITALGKIKAILTVKFSPKKSDNVITAK